jgi:hypothetical protein
MVSAFDHLHRRISLLQLIAGLGALVVAHAVYVFVVYRARVLTHSALASSDLVLFALPAIAVFMGCFFLLRARRIRIISPWVAALLVTFLSFWVSMLIPINTYGT